MSNTALTVLAIAVLAAHGLVGIAALRLGPWSAPVAALNLLVGAAVLVAIAFDGHVFRQPLDWQILGLAAFELLTVTAAILAVRSDRSVILICCVVFGLHFAASAAAVTFMLTFRITRLI